MGRSERVVEMPENSTDRQGAPEASPIIALELFAPEASLILMRWQQSGDGRRQVEIVPVPDAGLIPVNVACLAGSAFHHGPWQMKIEPATPRVLIALIAAAGLSMAVPHASAQPDRSHLAPLSLEQLQEVYLECDVLATHSFLDGATAAECSLVAQELLKRGFGGDFNQLLEWWRTARREKPEPVEPETDAAGML